MIEDVSNRIRNIINSQDYTPKQRLLKSRDISTQKQESVKSRKNLHYPPKTPESKFKRKDSELFQKQYGQPKSSRQQSNMMTDLKKQVLSIIEPLLYEMEKRILQKLISLQSQYLYTTEIIHEMQKNKPELAINYSTFGREPASKRQQILEEVYKIIDPMEKHNNKLEQEIRGIREKLFTKLKDIEFEGKKKNKCKCEPLVEEILRSQSHLMMQLKYIKHFRGKSDGIR